ncbi:uroporphyrinogen-III synthase [Thalassotalea sp. LPB0316]|uniref:uroporphyrinogen-III synthase n=1 Tax=Thalassotalea sp. LPB0316 TaxID=2769490 RepID=UPI0018692B55|nr:uroporphyrinogen-III synthase [Thalassotalea sp. LPB0316]QOL26302.1 uroporphyrinogen-III synthase [Thalassotalea sp. LPB0316]
MTKHKPHVLVTRPEPKGRELTALFIKHGYKARFEPLFDYQAHALATEKPQADIAIFISQAAVEFAQQQSAINRWQVTTFIAVGQATQLALEKLGISAISPDQQNSEGMLALPALSQVDNKSIIIIRGDEGRELLFEQLVARGAKVTYLQSYQRLWRTFPSQMAQQWHQEGINFIICTSVAMLEKMAKLLVTTDNYWQRSCIWVVASARIYAKAKQLELTHIILAKGASNQDLLTACQNGSNYDR